MDNAEIVRRFGMVESERTTVEANWNIIRRFVVPFRGEMFRKPVTTEHAIDWHKRELYDDTAITAAQGLAASLQQMTSPSTQWFSLRFRNAELNTSNEPKRWLEDCGKRIFAALQDSNFNLEANELYLDLTSFATGAILEESIERDAKFDKLDFTAIPIKECFFEQGNRGPLIFYRRMYWPPSRIVDKFGLDNVPKHVLELYEQASQSKLELLFCVYPRHDKEGADLTRRLSATDRPFGYKYVLRETGEMVGDEGGYYEMPAFMPRWSTSSESIWGNGPAHAVLATVLSANELAKVQLKAAGKQVDPPLKANEMALLTTPNLRAASLNIMRDINGIEPMLHGGNLAVGDMRLEDLRRMIREAFHVDDLKLKESPQMTATEVQVRYELMQRHLGVALARLQADFLDLVIERTMGILMRAGMLEPPPQEVVEVNADMDIIYLGPLARAQRMDAVASVERYLSLAAGMVEVLPAMLERVDGDELAKGVADELGIPVRYLRSDAAVQGERQQREQAQQRQMEAMTQQAEGDAMKAQAEAQAVNEGQAA